MSPRKQILLALIIGPFIGWGAVTLVTLLDKPTLPAPIPASQIQKQYITGFIGKEYVELKIVKE